MSVYVDSLFPTLKTKGWPYSQACHLYADTEKELLNFAYRLGLKIQWYQWQSSLPHYDLTRNMRYQAIRLGAIEAGPQKVDEMINIYRSRKKGTDSTDENRQY